MSDKQDSVPKSVAVRRQIWSALPKDFKSNFWYYKRNVFHAASYVGIFGGAYYLQELLNRHPPQILSLSLFGFKIEIGNLLKYLISPIISWSVVGIILIGHEASHNTFAPSNNKLGKIVNFLVKNSFIDFFAIGDRFSFRRSHDQHHKYVNVQSDTDMIYLDYHLGFTGEIIHAISVIIDWNLKDLKELFNLKINPIKKPTRWVWKPYMILTFVIRCLFWGAAFPIANNSIDTLIAGIAFRPNIAISNLLWLAHFFNIIFFLPHSTPVFTNEKNGTNDEIIYVLRNAWDLYPSNSLYDQFQQWLHCGGATPHCSHHCMPFVPRSLLHIVSKEIAQAYPNEYRPITSMKDEINLWKTRKVFGFASEIPETIEMRNKFSNQIISYDEPISVSG